MKAHEARKRALEITSTAEKSQLDTVYNKIGDAVDNGKFECHLYEYLMPAVEKQLTKDGYKTNYSSHRNESLTTISW